MIKRITTLALIVANRAKALNPNVNLGRIKKSALSLIIATLFLLPTSYALQQKLVVNFRSPPIGAEVPPLPPGPGTYDPGKTYTWRSEFYS